MCNQNANRKKESSNKAPVKRAWCALESMEEPGGGGAAWRRWTGKGYLKGKCRACPQARVQTPSGVPGV